MALGRDTRGPQVDMGRLEAAEPGLPLTVQASSSQPALGSGQWVQRGPHSHREWEGAHGGK